MLTRVRTLVPKTEGQLDRKAVLAREAGAISTILARAEEAIRESLLRGGYEKGIIEFRTEPSGLRTFAVMVGPELNTR